MPFLEPFLPYYDLLQDDQASVDLLADIDAATGQQLLKSARTAAGTWSLPSGRPRGNPVKLSTPPRKES